MKQSTVVLLGALAVGLVGCGGKPAEPVAVEAPQEAGVTEAMASEAFAVAVAREEAATLDGGENLNRMTEVQDKRQLSRHDVDGDGVSDTVVGVVFLQNGSGDYSEQKVLAWRAVDGKLQELDASEVSTGEIAAYRVEGKTLKVDTLMHGADGEKSVETRDYAIGDTKLEWL
ncbi:hypothetical protein ABB30_09350 [Stenotrophomonas ginsengisoli]|uniref:Lipoprotein n=1 Tax=Stenotrophomonas ginsengisoli TaxID=336566 RepID=A0A0R0DE21_9GAMM|nr:hypothetical protein [Stenotrophomonas ginsengisoli]KRG76519.1 hypothetical protein ABB30_09350 [Stenotrophomonas ginsengisoli]